MSACAKEIEWTGGKHIFDLNSRRVSWMLNQQPFPGQYGDTPAAAFKRFEEGVYSPDDIERVFRIGLVGGGLSEREAGELIDRHVRGQPLAPSALIAYGVLTNLFVGVEHDHASA